MTNKYTDMIHAKNVIERLTTHTDDCTSTISRHDDEHTIAGEMLSDLLTSDPDDLSIDNFNYDFDPAHYKPGFTIDLMQLYARLVWAVRLINDEFMTDYLSHLLLSYSLCPMHRVDYAICFDDNDPECAILRQYFPNHDT